MKRILRLRLSFLPVVGALVSFTGCTHGPRQGEEGATLPARWQGRHIAGPRLDTAGLARWWSRFGDPVLNEVVSVALGSSPDLQTALARIEESRARRGVAASALFPSITGTGSGRGSRTDNVNTGVISTESYDASLNMSWEIDMFGKRRQSVKAASADLAQVTENYHGAQVSLAADVAAAYVSLRVAEAQLAVVENSLGTRRETVQLTQWREQAGESSRLESQQALSILEQARASIPALKQTIGQTRNQIALLSGQTPGALDRLLTKSRPVPSPPRMLSLGIPAETLRQRPDVRAAEHGIEAAIARTKSAKAERYPTLTLSGTLGIEALQAGRLFSPETTAASILGNLSAPIFNAGRIRETINIQSAQERQAVMAYVSTVLKALSEVENALIAIQRTSERLETLKLAVTAAREAATLASLQYEAGQSDLLTVLDAQRTLLSLEEQQAIATGNRANAHIQLYRALGGGWR